MREIVLDHQALDRLKKVTITHNDEPITLLHSDTRRRRLIFNAEGLALPKNIRPVPSRNPHAPICGANKLRRAFNPLKRNVFIKKTVKVGFEQIPECEFDCRACGIEVAFAQEAETLPLAVGL